MTHDLGGVMFWSLDLDDFTGDYCGHGPYPLLSAINNTVNSLLQAPEPFVQALEETHETVPNEDSRNETASHHQITVLSPLLLPAESGLETDGQESQTAMTSPISVDAVRNNSSLEDSDILIDFHTDQSLTSLQEAPQLSPLNSTLNNEIHRPEISIDEERREIGSEINNSHVEPALSNLSAQPNAYTNPENELRMITDPNQVQGNQSVDRSTVTNPRQHLAVVDQTTLPMSNLGAPGQVAINGQAKNSTINLKRDSVAGNGSKHSALEGDTTKNSTIESIKEVPLSGKMYKPKVNTASSKNRGETSSPDVAPPQSTASVRSRSGDSLYPPLIDDMSWEPGAKLYYYDDGEEDGYINDYFYYIAFKREIPDGTSVTTEKLLSQRGMSQNTDRGQLDRVESTPQTSQLQAVSPRTGGRYVASKSGSGLYSTDTKSAIVTLACAMLLFM